MEIVIDTGRKKQTTYQGDYITKLMVSISNVVKSHAKFNALLMSDLIHNCK